MKHNTIRRGEIYMAELDPTLGSEQGGTRPVLILQNNVGNRFSPTVIVAPITSEIKKRHLPTHVPLPDVPGLPSSSMVLLEQIRTIDKSRLDSFMAQLDANSISRVVKAIEISLALIDFEKVKRELEKPWPESE